MQLLQMKVQIPIIVEQLRMKLINQMRGLLNTTTLNSFTNQDAIIQGVEGDRWLDTSFDLKLFSGLLDALWMVEMIVFLIM